MRIRIVSDVICPWCHIGERNLTEALARRPELEVHLEMLPYRLHPEIPPEGVDREAFFRRKFGGSGDAVVERIRQAGREAGIDFRFDRMERIPNTIAAHALLSWARETGVQREAARRLFVATFEEGEDVGRHEVLARLGGEVGLDADEVAERLAAEDGFDEVRAEAEMLRSSGITGVPFFLFEDRYPVVGAQPVETLVKVLDAVAEKSAEIPVAAPR